MLTLQDCLDMCDLSEDMVETVAEHQHLPPIVAAELAACLASAPGGLEVLRSFLVEGIERSRRCGDAVRAERLRQCLCEFERSHPDLAHGQVGRA